MKYWKCPYCHTERKTNDNVIICICPCCCSTMEEIKRGKDDGNRSK